MPSNEPEELGGAADRSLLRRQAELANQGQSWRAIGDTARFRKPGTLFDQPMEISIAMLRGLRMVDETIVVHGDVVTDSNGKDERS